MYGKSHAAAQFNLGIMNHASIGPSGSEKIGYLPALVQRKFNLIMM
jgi:hypothetical protein